MTIHGRVMKAFTPFPFDIYKNITTDSEKIASIGIIGLSVAGVGSTVKAAPDPWQDRLPRAGVMQHVIII